MSPHFDDVVATLRADPQARWGFIIYRCTYGDDTAWARMLSRLNVQTRDRLTTEGASDLFARID